MSDEIKVGSVWRDGRDNDQTIEASESCGDRECGYTYFTDGTRIYTCLLVRHFRKVRDPEPILPMPGTWWCLTNRAAAMLGTSPKPTHVVSVVGNAVECVSPTTWGASLAVFREQYEPCDPPPREKAIAELARLGESLVNSEPPLVKDVSRFAAALAAYKEASK